MDKRTANVLVAAILETVAEVEGGCPSGHMYAAMVGKVELADFEALLGICKSVGLVNVAPSHLVTITPKGREAVAKIKAARA